MCSLLSHPNICPMWSLTSSSEAIPAVAMPWFTNGNVVEFIRQNPGINKLAIVSLVSLFHDHIFDTSVVQIKQFASGVAYVHAMGKVHGNIVPVSSSSLPPRWSKS